MSLGMYQVAVWRGNANNFSRGNYHANPANVVVLHLQSNLHVDILISPTSVTPLSNVQEKYIFCLCSKSRRRRFTIRDEI